MVPSAQQQAAVRSIAEQKQAAETCRTQHPKEQGRAREWAECINANILKYNIPRRDSDAVICSTRYALAEQADKRQISLVEMDKSIAQAAFDIHQQEAHNASAITQPSSLPDPSTLSPEARMMLLQFMLTPPSIPQVVPPQIVVQQPPGKSYFDKLERERQQREWENRPPSLTTCSGLGPSTISCTNWNN